MSDAGRRTRSLHAPAWLEELVRTNRPAVPWRDVVRFAVAIPAPLAVAVLAGDGVRPGPALSAGVFATMGALVATLAPQAGPLRDKLRRITAATSFGVLGLLVGGFAAGGGWAPVAVIALVSAAAALISQVNATMSLAALQLLIYTALASGFVSSLRWYESIGCFLLGAAWATLLTLAQTATEATDPDRTSVAAVFTRIADLMEAGSAEDADEARRALTTALNAAYDRVIRSRSHTAGRVRELSELAGVLNSAAPLVEGSVAAARARVPADPVDVAAVRDLAAALTGERELPGRRPPPAEEGHPTLRAVRHGVRLVWNVVGDPEERAGAAAPRPERDRRIRIRELVDRTLASADSRAFAVRLALCMSIAEVARQWLPTNRPYWVLLTVAIVLKPDFGSVFGRAVQRGAGTLLGVLIGSALLAVFPRSGWLVVAMALLAGVLPWARAANFGLFSVFQTPVILLMLDLTLDDPGLVSERLVDTLIGCGIVLVFGYLLWPQTWRAPLDQALRDAALALDAFVEAAFTGSSADRRRARRRTYRALTELQTQLQRRLAEPPPISTRAAAWWPVIVQLERTADAVTEAVIATRQGEPVPDLAQVAVLRRAIRQLEDDARTPVVADDDAELLADGVLAPVAREVDTARRLVRENAPGRRAAGER